MGNVFLKPLLCGTIWDLGPLSGTRNLYWELLSGTLVWKLSGTSSGRQPEEPKTPFHFSMAGKKLVFPQTKREKSSFFGLSLGL